jgi:hypothetical protein
MAKAYQPAQIANAFFELADANEKGDGIIEEYWKCLQCDHQVKRTKGKGWTNLAQHAIKHDGWRDVVDAFLKNGRGSMDRYVQKKIGPAAWNIYHWLEWIIMDDLPFNFVERELTAANTKLLPICSKTFIKYMELTHEAVEAKVNEILPPTFGIVVDGWTRFREHYFAMYAVYTDANDNVQEILLSCGVQEEDEDSDSMDFTAESIGAYIFR